MDSVYVYFYMTLMSSKSVVNPVAIIFDGPKSTKKTIDSDFVQNAPYAMVKSK